MAEQKRSHRKLSFKQRLKVFIAAKVGAVLLRFIHATLRWEKVGFNGDKALWGDKEPIIGVFWHGRQLMIPWVYLEHKSSNCKREMFVLISHHTDGRIISEIMRALKISTVFGSSSYGGVNALRSLAAKIEEGHHVCFTPDGPRGPRYKAKQGVLSLAVMTGATILPVTYSAKRVWKLSSWDGMIIPKPFSPAVYILGEPLRFPKDLVGAEFDQALLQLEATLNEMTERADNWFNK